MNALFWWRSWHNAPIDHKWAVIAARAGSKPGIVSAVAWALMDFASQQKERGTIAGFDAEVYAVYSGFPESEVIAIIQAMTEKGIIVDGKFHKWDERQPKREDDSTPRVQKLRNALKQNVTQGNANVTQGNDKVEDETFVSLSLSLSDSSNSDSVLNTSNEEEDEAFDKFQRELEGHGIIPNNVPGIKAINDIIQMGATIEDLRAGIAWLSGNIETGKVMYPSRVVGPTKTAMQKRLQNGNGRLTAKEYRYINADGLPCDEMGNVKP